ncbi:hypothetical protein NLJ89_g9539 [Agrocybe chaxingu]|uniref:Uncharacterized protein n=1 Tax=Agrocybe chaxingu TaxID=84603 RepID=A0A9W8JSU9_9AGAR|nr:hypothetical protein NLJ89_g9539 [Agrocybe chaxingu]
MEESNDGHPRPVYHTPTRSAARVLEEMVAAGALSGPGDNPRNIHIDERTLQPKASSSSASSSSSSERRSLRRTGKARIGPSGSTDVFGNIAWNTGLGAGTPLPPFPSSYGANRAATSENPPQFPDVPPVPPVPPLPPFPPTMMPEPQVPFGDVPPMRDENPLPPIPPSPPNPLLEPPSTHVYSSYEGGRDAPAGHSPERSPSSMKSRRPSESLHRRILEEVVRHHPEQLASLYANDQDHERHHERHHDRQEEHNPSPTDSHPHRSQSSQTRPRTTSNSRTRSRSASDSARLLLTTERLNSALARAANVEKQLTDLMSLFKTTYEAKVELERDLTQVRAELNGYKVMLDVAQNEIDRAQEVVDRLERQRVEAENEAVRARQSHRKIQEARAVELAMEEGRRLGYEEGVQQGRNLNQLYDYMDSQAESRRAKRDGDEDREVARSTRDGFSLSGSSTSRRSRRSSSRSVDAPQLQRPISAPRSRPRSRSGSVTAPTEHPHGTPPDVMRYSDLLPVPTLSTPPPIRVPSTQPQPAPPMPPEQPPLMPHPHVHHRDRSNSRPETIDVNDNTPIRPISVHNHSPSVIHRPIVLPPDNYIPTMGANSMISLPPPHELSLPVAPEAPATRPVPPSQSQPPPPTAHSSTTSRPRMSSRAAEKARENPYAGQEEKYARAPSRASASRTVDPYFRRQTPGPGVASSSRAISVASTRLSELDLLESPAAREEQHARAAYDARSRSRNEADKPKVERGRATPGPGENQTRKDATSSRVAGPSSLRNTTERPTSPDPTRVRSPATYPNRPPRRPREIILPTPLAGKLLGNNMAPSAGASGQSNSRSWENPLRPSLAHLQAQLSPPSPPHNSRSTSNMTVPGIEIHTPSSKGTSHSEQTNINRALLTPEGSNQPLPQSQPQVADPQANNNSDPFLNRVPDDLRISMVVRDDNLPAGFVPLSPIPGMANINPYPPGFTPSLPRNHPAGGTSNFAYPSAPLVRVS